MSTGVVAVTPRWNVPAIIKRKASFSEIVSKNSARSSSKKFHLFQARVRLKQHGFPRSQTFRLEESVWLNVRSCFIVALTGLIQMLGKGLKL